MSIPDISLIPLKSAVCSERATVLDVIVRIAPPSLEISENRRPSLNLGFVIDRSGSMASRNKIDYARQAVCFAIDQLLPNDRLSVTIFDDQVQTLIPSTLANNKASFKRLVQQIQPGGCTALHSGWVNGGIQVSQNLTAELNRIILLSDGLANRGETNADVIASDVHGLARRGASTTTMGLGDDYNEDLLQAMAMSGDGNYYYITDAEQLPGIFERELQGLASTLGTAVTLALEPLGQVQVSDVLNDLEVDGQGRFKLSNLVYGSPLDVVVRLTIPAVAPETELCAFTLAWLDTEHLPQSRRVVLTLPAVSQQDYEHLPANELVQQQVALMMAARAKQEAIRRADQGDVQGAQSILSDSSEQLRSFDFAMAAPEVAALNELQEQLGSGKFEVFRKQASSQRYKRSHLSSSGHSDLVYAFRKGPRLGDITQQQVEAIVNSTDRFLSDQGMVSGAIHRAAGPELLAACRQLNGCAVGNAQITPGFNLPAPWVIHTVCPPWQDGHSEASSLLARCYQACLDLAVAQGIKSIAFPALGCGALGFPPEIAARIAFETVSRYLLSSTAIGTVLFICHDTATLTHFQQAFKRVSAW